jgi:hypothetical protein
LHQKQSKVWFKIKFIINTQGFHITKYFSLTTSILITILVFCTSNIAAIAESNEITNFELGGASNSPGIANKSELIIEENLMHYQTKFTGRNSFSYQLGQTKLRYGIIQNKFETRLIGSGLTLNRIDSGFSNISLGTKIRLLDESKYLPSTDIITDWEIPIGDRDLRNPGFDHSYMLVLGKAWSKKFGSIANISLDFASFKSDTGIGGIVSAPLVFNINYYFKPELNVFSHIYGTHYFTDGIDNPLSVDLGFSYAMTKDLVLISSISKGLNEAAQDMTLDLGFVYRP